MKKVWLVWLYWNAEINLWILFSFLFIDIVGLNSGYGGTKGWHTKLEQFNYHSSFLVLNLFVMFYVLNPLTGSHWIWLDLIPSKISWKVLLVIWFGEYTSFSIIIGKWNYLELIHILYSIMIFLLFEYYYHWYFQIQIELWTRYMAIPYDKNHIKRN